jgi:RNA-binding protein with serine-rich domain 1
MKKVSPARKLRTPTPEPTVLHIGCLTRHVNEAHLKEIFSIYGEVVHVELAMDRTVNLPKGFGYVEFRTRAEAEKAQEYMDGGQIDGNIVSAQFILVPRKKSLLPPPKSEKSPPLKRGDGIGREPLPRDDMKDVPHRRECKSLFCAPN